MAGARFSAPLDTQHRMRIRDDSIDIRPSWVKVGLIRVLLLGFGGVVVGAAVRLMLQVGIAWISIPLLLATLLGLVMLVGAFAPWRTTYARIDAAGLELGGRGAAVTGHVPWSRVTNIVATEGDGRTIGVALDDGRVVGLLKLQRRSSGDRLIEALERLGGLSSGPSPVLPRPPAALGDEGWPPAAPPGFPDHGLVAVDQMREGVAIGPRSSGRRRALRMFSGGLGLGVVGILTFAGIHHLYGLRWPDYHFDGWDGPAIAAAALHVLLFAVAVGSLYLGSSLARHGWRLRRAPHRHLVTDSRLVVLDRDGAVEQQFALSDLRGIEAGGWTLVVDLPGDKRVPLFFDTLGDSEALYWALRAMEYALAQAGWSPARPRQDRADFDRTHGWRPSISKSGESTRDERSRADFR